MKVKDLIKSLADYNPNTEVFLDTSEGESFLKLDDCYKNDKKIILYASVFNMDNQED